MKKIIIATIMCLFFINLFSVNFTEFYYKDYGIISRTVLVFDKKIDYDIKKQGNTINVSVLNCHINDSVQEEEFFNNKVLKATEYERIGDDLIALITATRLDSLNYITIAGKPFKLVIDIFSKKPYSYQDYIDFAEFYQTIGQKENSAKYYAKAEEARLNPPPPEEEPKSNLVPEPETQKNKNPIMNRNIQLFVLLILIIILIIYLVIRHRNKTEDIEYAVGEKISGKKKKKKAISLKYPTAGFGTAELKESLMLKFIDANWESVYIARELQIATKEVDKFRKKMS
jgi:hypothetical protein